jgi:hypothetical protein
MDTTVDYRDGVSSAETTRDASTLVRIARGDRTPGGMAW